MSAGNMDHLDFLTGFFMFGGLDAIPAGGQKEQSSQSNPVTKRRTFRISRIPIGTTKESLLDELKTMARNDPELMTMLNKANQSRCTLASKSPHYACSTLEVQSHLSPEEIVQRFTRLAETREFRFDCHFIGITPLFEDKGRATVDVVAIPGLASHPIGSWTCSDNSGDFWLRDFVPRDICNARVLIYGYDSKLNDSVSAENIHTMGSAFLDSLKAFRESTETLNRPIIFIAHSLGGLLLKETLLQAHDRQKINDGYKGIADGCYALLMFGVPNTGLKNREELQAIVKGQANESLINDVVIDRSGQPAAYLGRLKDQFALRCEDRYKVVCFYETKLSPTVEKQKNGRLAKTGPKMMLVTKESACDVGLTTLLHQYHVNLQKDHSGLCKLDGTDDYPIVMGWLKALAKEASLKSPTEMLKAEDKRHLVRSAILAAAPPFYTLNSERFPDTGWILETSEYRQWISNIPLTSEDPAMVTLQGGLGTGKTVLIERAFKEAENSKTGVNIWHCFDNSSAKAISILRNSRRGLLLSLFVELLNKVEHKPWEAIRQLSADPQLSEPGLGLIPDAFFEEQVLNLLNLNKTTDAGEVVTFRFFIDALEQCSNTGSDTGNTLTNVNDELKKILGLLTKLVAMREVDIRLCVARRPTPTFNALEPTTAIIKLEDYIVPLVQTYLKSELKALSDKSIYDLLYPRLAGHASNGYLWASFIVEDIKAKARSNSRDDLFKLVYHIPDKMRDMYKDVLDTLDRSYNPDAVRLLQIVLVATEHMTINQLRHALGLTKDFPFSSTKEWDRSRFSEPTDDIFVTRLRELTHGLLTVSRLQISSPLDYEKVSTRAMICRQNVPVVTFAHSTTEKYLRETVRDGPNSVAKELVDSQSHVTLLTACFRALEIFGSDENTEEPTFINYACEFWLHHATGAGDLLANIDREVIPDFVLQCDFNTSRLLDRQMKLLKQSHAKEQFVLGAHRTELIVYAAAFGCTGLIRLHLEECQGCKKLPSLSSALQSSITCRWPETTQYLLSVYCEATGSLENDGFLLYKACYAGDIKTVEFLLGKGANPSVRHFRGYFLPLHAAIIKGRADIVALILDTPGQNAESLLAEKGIEIGTTALHLVLNMRRSSYDKVAVLKKMLKHIPRGSKILHIEDGNGDTPNTLVRKMVVSGQEGSWRLEASLLDKVGVDSQ